MEVVPKKKLILVAGRGHPELSAEVAEHLRVPLGDCVLSTFANGEIYCRYGESIRGADVFVFQTHGGAINDMLMEQLIMIDAAKRASAKRITAVCPYYGYSRQDRKSTGREPITAKLTRAPGNNAPIGGLKVVARNGWFAARPSGTEAVYKIYAESFKDEAHLDAIVSEAQEMVNNALSSSQPVRGQGGGPT